MALGRQAIAVETARVAAAVADLQHAVLGQLQDLEERRREMEGERRALEEQDRALEARRRELDALADRTESQQVRTRLNPEL